MNEFQVQTNQTTSNHATANLQPGKIPSGGKPSFSKKKQQTGLYTITTYIVTMETTIQVSTGLRKELQDRKLRPKESYEDVIWDLIEDTKELSEETKREIAEARKEAKKGKVKPMSQIKSELGL